MRIFVKAKPLSIKESVRKNNDGSFTVSVTEPPVAGKANQAIIRSLAIYFKLNASQVKLVSGFSSRHKVVDISYQ